MWYSITGAFRSTGEDATEVIEADSEEEAIAKANDRGILVQEVTQTRRPRMDKLIGVLAFMVMAFAYVASGDGCSADQPEWHCRRLIG